MKNRLPDSNYINRLNSNQLTEEESKYNQLVQQATKSKYLGIVQLGKLTKIAEHLNISIEVVLDEIINTAYDLLPKTTANTLTKLVVPDNLVDFMQLTEYLRDRYTNQNEFVFSLFSYTALTEDIKRYKLSPSNLKNWLAYHYRNVNLTIKA